MSELDFIEKVSRVSRINDSIEIGIGDDCSVMQDKERKLVTVDMLSDMVHFDTNKDDPKLIGRKSLAVSLSDIAAMGGDQTLLAETEDAEEGVNAFKERRKGNFKGK